MDEQGLRAALERAGVPAADYILNTRSGPPRRHSGDHLYLDPQGAGWVVGSHERGQDHPLRRFASQPAALRFLYSRLTPRGPGPQPGVAQRMARISADQDEIQRDAWERFERAGDDENGDGQAG